MIMIEQKLEKKVIDALSAQLSGTSLSSTQIMGVWQVTAGEVKNYEGHSDSVITVKAQPRKYQTPTIPDAEIPFELNLITRQETDIEGGLWLSAVELVSNKLQTWQKSRTGYYDDFNLSGEFEPTGFNLDGGEIGQDDNQTVQLYNQTFTIYGIIQ